MSSDIVSFLESDIANIHYYILSAISSLREAYMINENTDLSNHLDETYKNLQNALDTIQGMEYFSIDDDEYDEF